jgi:hypothetical protein
MEDGVIAALADRLHGPFAFRLLMQPAMAAGLALRDGARSARAGERPFLAALLLDPGARRGRIAEAWGSVGKVAILAVALDLAFQLAMGGPLRLLDAAGVALLLAILPYALLRGPANRIIVARRRRPARDAAPDRRSPP